MLLVCLTLVALLVTACSSTAKVGSGANKSGRSGSGGIATEEFSTSTSSAGTAAKGQSAKTKGSSGTGSGSPSGSSGGGPLGPVEIGLIHNVGADDAARSFGFTGVAFGDQKRMFQNVVSDINKKGALGGHRIEPVFVAQDSADTRPFAIQQQAWCDSMTQDHHVAAVATIVGYGEVLTGCLAGRGVPLFARAGQLASPSYEKLGSYLYTLGAPPLDKGILAAAQALTARGFFGQGARVGLIYDNAADREYAKNSLKSYLRSAGISVTKEFELDGSPSATSSAVLSFNTAPAVTHVMFVSVSAATFMIAAHGQQFRPRYGLTSFDNPATVANVAPKDQLAGAFAEGWQPIIDVAYGSQPANSAAKRCIDLHNAAGTTFSDGSSSGFGMGSCDTLWLMQEGLSGTSSKITATLLAQGIARLGDTYASTLTLGSRFTTERHYGPAMMRDTAFDGTSFIYSSATLRDIP